MGRSRRGKDTRSGARPANLLTKACRLSRKILVDSIGPYAPTVLQISSCVTSTEICEMKIARLCGCGTLPVPAMSPLIPMSIARRATGPPNSICPPCSPGTTATGGGCIPGKRPLALPWIEPISSTVSYAPSQPGPPTPAREDPGNRMAP
eukprot:scaffold11393_cov30-Tisochrysis_lutea.AAC.2